MFLGLDRTPCAAGVNTYLNITVKQQATCASLVSLKSLHSKTVLEVYSTQCELQHLCGLLFLMTVLSGNSCSGFQSPYTCGCGQPSSEHQTLVRQLKHQTCFLLVKEADARSRFPLLCIISNKTLLCLFYLLGRLRQGWRGRHGVSLWAGMSLMLPWVG